MTTTTTAAAAFEIASQTVEVFTCADGEKFNSREEAIAHNEGLIEAARLAEAEAGIVFQINAYCNLNGVTGRSRSQKEKTIRLFLEWAANWDGVTDEATLDLSEEELNPVAVAEAELQGTPFGEDAQEAYAETETELEF